VLFSTGRGTPFGGFIPTVKISTNTSLYEKKQNWIDFDSGDISDDNYEAKVESLINLVVDVIEGKKTRNEINEFREIAIFKKGVTL
jgi:altronate hydrolase